MEEKAIHIAIDNLTIGYKNPIVRHISAKIEAGSLIGLIGENGAGKSTLLKTLARFISPLQGEIAINNKRLENFSLEELSKILSIVTTQRVSISHYKVEDVVAFGRYPYGKWTRNLTGQDKEIVFNAIDDVQGKHLTGKYINELSDGEYQRIMIARCLAQNTPVILLDEPTAFLDLNGKYEIINLLQTLANQRNKIIIFSSHDLSLAIKYVSKLWFIQHNELLEDTPEDLILSGNMERIIHSSLISFNAISGDFECAYQYHSKLNLSGSDLAVKWTKNALNKLGWTVTNQIAYPSLQINENKNYFTWIYKQSNESEEIEFYSMNDLSLFLKRLTKNKTL